MAEALADDVLRARGMAVLEANLGPVEALRFLALLSHESFDYQSWRDSVRLPKDFRFPPDTEEVEVHREGDRIVLEPVQVEEWPKSFWRAFEGMPDDFARPSQVRQTRESFDL